MKSLAIPVIGAVSLCLVSLAQAQTPAAQVLAGLSGLATTTLALVAYRMARKRAKERQSLDKVLGTLAEFSMPVVQPDSPSVVRQLVEGYATLGAELQQRFHVLQERVRRYEFIAQHAEDLVVQVDGDGKARYVSPSVREHLGFAPEDLQGRRFLDLLHPDAVDEWIAQLKQAARTREAALLEGRLRRADGNYVTLEVALRHAYGLNGQVIETIGIGRNVEARNALRDQLERAALTDHLTGLPNRAALVRALERFRASSRSRPFALFLFDLDRFKQVNDSLGHAAGDDYLVETAARVRSVLRPTDTLARMGGDEFVALFADIHTEEAARTIATRIIDTVTQPFQCRGSLLHPKTSIGILLCDDAVLPADELIMRADRAMYDAKAQGGNMAVVYDTQHSATSRQSFLVEQQLAAALKEQRLIVQFQPIVSAGTKRPVLAEALVRMLAEDGSLIGPEVFIDIAEQSGLIIPLGQWVLEQACQHARRLELAGKTPSISVNVSPRQLMHIDYVQSVQEVVQRTGVSPASIVLEVTESAVMQDLPRAGAALTHLRQLGFRLALDDFGTGYSSLSMLKHLSFDMLKIDRTFVVEVEGQPDRPSTLAAILDIGKSLNLTIIAEGIETEAQSEGLERLGCDLLQGFRFHRPLNAEDHAAMVKPTDVWLDDIAPLTGPVDV
jgi:diguanylate cyclase (GGDEF)-like protein/PAS domain S-box-containing protein